MPVHVDIRQKPTQLLKGNYLLIQNKFLKRLLENKIKNYWKYISCNIFIYLPHFIDIHSNLWWCWQILQICSGCKWLLEQGYSFTIKGPMCDIKQISMCDFSESDPWLQPHGHLLSVYTLLLTYSLFFNDNKTVKSESMPFGQINPTLNESPSEQEKTIQYLGSHRPSISNIRSRYLKIKKLIMLGKKIHFPSTFLGSWVRHSPSPIKD